MSKGRWLFLAVLAVAAGTAVRFWHLTTSIWQYDEIVYDQVAATLLHHGGLTERITFGSPYQPFLYQPPWYPYGLAGWFGLVGTGIDSARVLGVLLSGCMLLLVWCLIQRQFGQAAALYTILPLAFDGWLLYIERVGYIENLILVVIAAGFLLYQRALDRPSWLRFAAAGAMFGLAGCLKYTGLYVVMATVLSWLILHRHNREHLLLLASAVGMIVLDQLVLIAWWGHSYLAQNGTQLARVLGIQSSGGTVTSPGELVHLLFRQYHIFIASFVLALAGLVIIVRYLIRCYRARSWEPVRHQAILFSWAVVGMLTLGGSNLRFPQYFALVLVPLYLLAWTESWAQSRALKTALCSAAVAAGLGSFWLSAHAQSANPLEKVQRYAATRIPATAVVVADEQVGDLLRQPYCREGYADPCLHDASYAITWDTYLQKTSQLGDPAFRTEMEGAAPLWSSGGFNGTVTVWKLDPPPVVGVDVEADSNYPVPTARKYGRVVVSYIHNMLHAQALGIVWDLCDSSFRSSAVRKCAASLSVASVRAIVAEAGRAGLSVQLRPLIRVGPQAGWNDPRLSWEGYIRPADRPAWFRSLLRAETPYLRILRDVPGSQFVVGTEPLYTADDPGWARLLTKAQAICQCAVNVTSTGTKYSEGVMPPQATPGVDWYPRLNIPANAPQSAVTAAWEASLAKIPASLLAQTAFDEVSIRGTAGAYRHPEEWGIGGRPDPQVQARYFTAACQAVKRHHMRAVFFYEIPLEDNPASPMGFPAFFVRNPGSAAIRNCSALLNGSN